MTNIHELNVQLTTAMRSWGVQAASEELADVRRNPVGFPSDNPAMASFSSNAPTTNKPDRNHAQLNIYHHNG